MHIMWKIAFFHMLHSRTARTAFEQALQLGHSLLRATCQDLDRAVGEIAHESP